jgi:hypothetical protein
MARSRDRDFDADFDDADYDPKPRSSGGQGPLDSMYRDTNIVVLILFGCCCGLIAFALSLVAYITGKDEKAKSNAMIVMIVSGVLTIAGIILQVVGGVAGQLGR